MGHWILCQTFTLQLMWELKWVLYFGIVSVLVLVPFPYPHKFCLIRPSTLPQLCDDQWNQWSPSKMDCNAILEWHHCFQWEQENSILSRVVAVLTLMLGEMGPYNMCFNAWVLVSNTDIVGTETIKRSNMLQFVYRKAQNKHLFYLYHTTSKELESLQFTSLYRF